MATLTIHRNFLKMCAFILRSVHERFNLDMDSYRRFSFDKLGENTYKFTMYSKTIHVYFGVISSTADGFILTQLDVMQVDNSFKNN